MSKRLFDTITISELKMLQNQIDEESSILGKKIDGLLKQKKMIVRFSDSNALANEIDKLNNEIEYSCAVFGDLDRQLTVIDNAIRMKSSIDMCQEFQLNEIEMVLVTELIKRLHKT